MDEKLENFINAFSDCSTVKLQCACGKSYADSAHFPDIDEPDDAIHESYEYSDHPIGIVEFEGVAYAHLCTCWHERAQKIMNFCDHHRGGIIQYFSSEKQRLLAEANALEDSN